MKIAELFEEPVPYPEIRSTPKIIERKTDKFEREVFTLFREHKEDLGIKKVYAFRNARIDGAVKLDDGRVILIEVKASLYWSSACVARVEIGRFLNRPNIVQFYHERVSQKKPSGALIIFKDFRGDWKQKNKFNEDEAVLNFPDISIRAVKFEDLKE